MSPSLTVYVVCPLAPAAELVFFCVPVEVVVFFDVDVFLSPVFFESTSPGVWRVSFCPRDRLSDLRLFHFLIFSTVTSLYLAAIADRQSPDFTS